jgi:hypothetical protein
MPDTLKLPGENASAAGNAAEPLRADAPVVRLDSVQSEASEAGDRLRDGERTDPPMHATVDKGHRPAGRRFQIFTPPSLERDDEAEPVSESPEEDAPAGSTRRVARSALSRRSVMVTAAVAASAGLVVAAFMVLAVGRPGASAPNAASSSHEATYHRPLPEASSAASAVSIDAVPSHPPTAASSVPATPTPPRSAAPGVTPPVPTRQPTTATTAVAPGPAPIAPVEPPF